MLSWMLALLLGAEREIHACRDPAGRLVYQDQPCMGTLRRADGPPEPAPPRFDRFEPAAGSCQLRSPPIVLQFAVPEARPQAVAWVDQHGRPAPADWEPPEGLGALPEPERPAGPPPPVASIWLELNGTLDGLGVRIRGFEPPPPEGISFDPDIRGQGLRAPGGELVEVDSLDDPGTLRYGFRKARTLQALLTGPEAELVVRVRGQRVLPLALDTTALRDALTRLRACSRPGTPARPAAGTRRRVGG